MPSYLKKSKSEIINEQVQKVLRETPLTAVSPGSVVRSIIEVVGAEVADMYDILDYNISQTLLTTATGTALDLLGSVYSVTRRQVNELAVIDRKLGSFMFYLSAPVVGDITIPQGTNIYTDTTTYMGQRFSYQTTDTTVIPSGRTRAYASIVPNFSDLVYNAGKNTLVIHDFPSPPAGTVYCTNPKAISPQGALETDDQYRLRIIKQIRVAAAGTVEAVRFAGLSVVGVRDIRIRQAPYGMGSFDAIIVTERDAPTLDTINRAREAMNVVRPIGVRMFVSTPKALALDINADIISPGALNTATQDTLTKRAIVAATRYINALLPGSELVYNQLIQAILNSSETVKDVNVRSFVINNQEALRRNYQPNEDEQIVVGRLTINLARS